MIFAGRVKGYWNMHKGHVQYGEETSLCTNRLLVLGHGLIDYHAIALATIYRNCSEVGWPDEVIRSVI